MRCPTTGCSRSWRATVEPRRPLGEERPPTRERLAGGDRCGLLDRHADQAAVLGPRPVVVANAAVAEQLVVDEPRRARPLADPAVGDDVLVGRDALRLVQRREVLGVLERPVFLDRLGPWDRR